MTQIGWRDPALLTFWIVLGAGLRFGWLDSKPAWNDELATLVFSLGNSLRAIPLDQPISLGTLLSPLQPNSAQTINDVIDRLFAESTHPPVYFILTHLWLKLLPSEQGLVSIWAARSLSVLFGVAAIPAMFGLGWLTFRDRRSGQLAAALMAVSPYGVYLAQEARHYTLAILLIIASLSGFIMAMRAGDRDRLSLPPWLCGFWVIVNSLGIAVHYFFALVLIAEAIAWAWLVQRQKWRRVYPVAVGTVIGAIVWLPVWRNVSSNELTQWIYNETFLHSGIGPFYRLIAWMITMLALLPVEGVSTGVAIASGSIVLVFALWIFRMAYNSLKLQFSQANLSQANRSASQALLGVWAVSIALILGLTYALRADLTIAARYQFIYFPTLIALIAGTGIRLPLPLLLGLLGSLTVITNYGYQKPDRPDQLVPIIQQASQRPILIATAHETHEQTRELMGLALEYRRQSPSSAPYFLLAHSDPGSDTAETLQSVIEQQARPFDLWTVNFLPEVQPDVQSCVLDTTDRPLIHGYDYRLYHC